jgi:hypothetical protein
VTDRSYLERTIATVRNHREADNCWPQWANIFADEIERLWECEAERDRLLEQAREDYRKINRLREALRGYHDLAPRIAEYLNEIGAALAYSDLHRANEKAQRVLGEGQ